MTDKFKVLRYHENDNTVLGLLFGADFICYTLENTTKKIPLGKYKLGLRTYGHHHDKYKQMFSDIHGGMIEVLNVSGRSDILIHIGNDYWDSEGCLLVGNTSSYDFIGNSKTTYIEVYKIIADAIKDQGATIEYVKYENKGEQNASIFNFTGHKDSNKSFKNILQSWWQSVYQGKNR